MDIVVKRHNESFVQIICDRGIAFEIREFFTYRPKNYFFHPSFKAKKWDGKIYLFNVGTRLLHYGLWRKVVEFAETNDYTISVDPAISLPLFEREQLVKAFREMVDALNVPFKPYDFQENVCINSINDTRSLIESPTASGKTYIAYLITRFLAQKTIIIVPNTQLAHQMYKDWENYGYDCAKNVHVVTAGIEKGSTKPVVITTWQSVYKLDPKAFIDYKVAIGDEAHHCNAKSLVSVFDKLVNCKFRFGMSGSFEEDSAVAMIQLEGIFGKKYVSATTKELIDRGVLSDIEIEGIILKYNESDAEFVRTLKAYKEEIKFILQHQKRNAFIIKLASMLKGNVLVLFRNRKHGKLLFELAKALVPDRPVHFIDGTVKGSKRNDLSEHISTLKSSINICSFGTFAEGVNIPNLHNGIAAAPMKSETKNKQSRGRGLRKHDSKEKFKLYILGDDLTYNDKPNYALQHFNGQLKMHIKDKLNVTIKTVKL